MINWFEIRVEHVCVCVMSLFEHVWTYGTPNSSELSSPRYKGYPHYQTHPNHQIVADHFPQLYTIIPWCSTYPQYVTMFPRWVPMFQHLPLAICLGWALKLPSRYTFTNCLLFFGSGKTTKKTSDCIIYLVGGLEFCFFPPYVGNKSAPNRWLKGLGLLIFSVGNFPRKLGPFPPSRPGIKIETTEDLLEYHSQVPSLLGRLGNGELAAVWSWENGKKKL